MKLSTIILLFSLSFTFCIGLASNSTDSLLQIVQHSDDKRIKIDAYNQLSNFYSNQNQKLAISFADTAISLSELPPYHTMGKAEAYYNKGVTFIHIGEYITGEAWLNQARELYQTEGKVESEKEAEVLISLGVIRRKTGEFKQAREFYDMALEIATEIESQKILARVYNNIGYLLKLESQYSEAIQYFYSSLEMSKKLGDAKGLASRYSNIGDIYDLYIKDFETALDFHKKSLSIRDSLNDYRGICISLRNLGSLEIRRENNEKALEYLTRGLELADSINYKTLIASIHYQIANLYKNTGDLDKALSAIEKSITIHLDAQNTTGQVWSFLLCGEIHLDLKKYTEAYEYALKAYNMSKKLGKPEGIGYTALLLSRCYNKLGNYKEAYKYHLIYTEENDKLIDRVNIAKTATHRFQLESEREKEKLRQASREEQINFKYKQQQTAFIFAGILLSVLVIFLYVNFLNKKRANLELLIKNEELKVARKVAEEAVATKQNFLATMSHEIRTPMNAVLGFTDLLLESKPQKEQLQYLKYLKSSGEQLFNLLNDILDYSRIDVKKIHIESVDFNYRKLLEEVVGIYKSVENNNDKININLKIDSSNPNITLQGDPIRLKQILTNLIDNAIKFTPKGNVEIKASTKVVDNQKILLNVAVEDTGIGISEKDQAIIFDSFTQKGIASTRDYEGAGLGLSICKGLVEIQGGKIGVQSTPGKGSKFHFSIPHQYTQTSSLSISPVKNISPVEEKNIFAHKRVLVVEDNLLNQKILANILEKWGMEATITSCGSDALIQAKAQQFDVIMMDLFMPNMSGFETSKAIRQIQGAKGNVPIIAITASNITEVKQQVIDAEINHIIGKPFKKEKLLNIVKEIFSTSTISLQEAPYHAKI